MEQGPGKIALVVLLSGGLDSRHDAGGGAARKPRVRHATRSSFDYGQRHRVELDARENIAQATWASRAIAGCGIDTAGFGGFAGSALTDNLEVPKDRPVERMAQGIPVTYVPARNTIFLSYGLALAEVLGSGDLFIGVNAVDYSGYPDCRPEYLRAFQAMANLATRAAVQGRPLRIHAPLIDLTKTQIIRSGLALGVDYGLTHSCYDPRGAVPPAGTATPASSGRTPSRSWEWLILLLERLTTEAQRHGEEIEPQINTDKKERADFFICVYLCSSVASFISCPAPAARG